MQSAPGQNCDITIITDQGLLFGPYDRDRIVRGAALKSNDLLFGAFDPALSSNPPGVFSLPS